MPSIFSLIHGEKIISTFLSWTHWNMRKHWVIPRHRKSLPQHHQQVEQIPLQVAAPIHQKCQLSQLLNLVACQSMIMVLQIPALNILYPELRGRLMKVITCSPKPTWETSTVGGTANGPASGTLRGKNGEQDIGRERSAMPRKKYVWIHLPFTNPVWVRVSSHQNPESTALEVTLGNGRNF